jgi:small-conductance mechanosensitive channel
MLQLLFNGSQRSDTTEQPFQLSNISQFWTVKAVYTVVCFIMWILLHYRSQKESNHRESLRWITLVLNGIFMSAVFIFMISGAWALECVFLLDIGVFIFLFVFSIGLKTVI